MLVSVPTVQGEAWINPAHVVSVQVHRPARVLTAFLADGRNVSVDIGLHDAAAVLAKLGHEPSRDAVAVDLTTKGGAR